MMEEFKNTIRNNTGAADYIFYYELKTSKNWEIRVLFDIQQHVILFSPGVEEIYLTFDILQ